MVWVGLPPPGHTALSRRLGLLEVNTVVVNFEQLAANVLDTVVDVARLDTTFWGGVRPLLTFIRRGKR